MRRGLALIGVVTAVGFLATGCGSGGSSSTTTTTGATAAADWADGFCTAVTSWEDELNTIGKDLRSSPSKDGLQQAADGVKSANQKLSDDLKALGTPDTESGQQVKQSVDDLSTTLNNELTTIEDAAKNASGISGLASAASTIGTSLKTMGTAVSSTLTTIDNADATGEMKTAFDQASSCSDLTG